jgi:hypothetical protein
MEDDWGIPATDAYLLLAPLLGTQLAGGRRWAAESPG